MLAPYLAYYLTASLAPALRFNLPRGLEMNEASIDAFDAINGERRKGLFDSPSDAGRRRILAVGARAVYPDNPVARYSSGLGQRRLRRAADAPPSTVC